MILGVRHGERGDTTPNENEKKKVDLYFDPHLTEYGSLQAQMAAKEIQTKLNNFEQELRLKNLSSGKKIMPVIIASPFLRTIQTAYHITRNLDCVYENTIFLQNEIAELLWDQQEFNVDPLPLLFSKTRPLDKFLDFGLDFMNSGLKLSWNLFSNSEFISPKYPEEIEEAQKRIACFLKNVAKIFFEKFKYNEYVLVWVSHQYCLASAAWFYTGLTPLSFPHSLIDLCGILDCRYTDPENNLNEFKIRQVGTNEHL